MLYAHLGRGAADVDPCGFVVRVVGEEACHDPSSSFSSGSPAGVLPPPVGAGLAGLEVARDRSGRLPEQSPSQSTGCVDLCQCLDCFRPQDLRPGEVVGLLRLVANASVILKQTSRNARNLAEDGHVRRPAVAVGEAVDGVDRRVHSKVEPCGIGDGLGVDDPLQGVPQDAVPALDQTKPPVSLSRDDLDVDAVGRHVVAKVTSKIATLINAQVIWVAVRLTPQPPEGLAGGLRVEVRQPLRLM